AVDRGQQRPRTRELGEHTVERGGAVEAPALTVDGPGCPVGFRPRDAVALEHSGLLIGDGQHTASRVAPADPARAPRSNASGAVEQQDEALSCVRYADNLAENGSAPGRAQAEERDLHAGGEGEDPSDLDACRVHPARRERIRNPG